MVDIKKKVGRPTIYTDELADEFCLLLATTKDSVETICEENKHLPCKKTIFTWLYYDNNGFSHRYARAKDAQAELDIESTKDIFKKYEKDYVVEDDKGVKRIDSGIVQLAKLEIEHNKFMAIKRQRKVYGDAQQEQEVKKAPWVLGLRRKEKTEDK